MSEPSAPKTPTKAELLKHLDDLENKAVTARGQNNFNPFLWIKRNVTPLREEVEAAKDITLPLASKVMSTKLEIPKPVVDEKKK